jgi:hypothetical protein
MIIPRNRAVMMPVILYRMIMAVFGLSPEPGGSPGESAGTPFTRDMETILIDGSESFKILCNSE